MGKPKKKDLPDLSHLAVAGQEIVVRVTPNAARTQIVLSSDGVKIQVTAAPEHGKATAAAQRALAIALGLAPKRVQLLRGATSRSKVFRVTVD